MSRLSPTIVMAILLGGLGTYLYFWELPNEEAKRQEETQAVALLTIPEQEISGLTIRSSFLPDISLEKDTEKQWMITVPLKTEAQKQEVEALLRALILGRVTRTLDETPTDIQPFGLKDPTLVVTVNSSTKTETITIGDSGPISSTLYAMRDHEKKILLTNLAPKDFLNKSLMTFRNKDILDFDQSKVGRLKLTYSKQELVFYRSKKNGKDWWKIRAPLETNADQTEVKVLLLKIQDLKAIGFIDPGPDQAKTRSTFHRPAIKITLDIQGQDRTVQLYQPDTSSGEAFAMTEPNRPIYRINPLLIKDLTKDLFRMRNKRLLGIEEDQIALLEIKNKEHTYVLARQQEDWIVESQPQATINQQTVDLFLSRVISLPAELVVTPKKKSKKSYGFTTPSATFTATNMTGKTFSLVIGTRTGGLAYAKGSGLPGTYQVRSDILEQIPGPSDLTKREQDPMQK